MAELKSGSTVNGVAIVVTTDSRMTDSRPASDVYSWAKAATKPGYTYTEVGAASSGHNHDSDYRPISYVPSWAEITGKPSTFAPSAHTHPGSDITGAEIEIVSGDNSTKYQDNSIIFENTVSTSNFTIRNEGALGKIGFYTGGNAGIAFDIGILGSHSSSFYTDLEVNGLLSVEGGMRFVPGGSGYVTNINVAEQSTGRNISIPDADGTFALQEWVTAQSYLDSAHTTSHPVPTNRDTRNQVAGTYLGTAHTTTHPAPTNRDTRNQVAGSYAASSHNHDAAYLGITAKAADSEKVDGINGASLLRSDADDSFSGALTSSARNNGIFGTYDSNKTDHIWSMGTGYKNAADGSDFGNLYGLAYKHTNNPTGGAMAGGHQMVWCINGAPQAALGDSGMWTESHGTSANWKTAYDHSQAAHAPSDATSAGVTGDAHAGTAHAPSNAEANPAVGDGGLTQKNFTTTLKDKLDGIAAGATNTAAPYYTAAVPEVIAAGASGLMTGADKTKLNGIATGATNTAAPYYTAAATWASITGKPTTFTPPAATDTVLGGVKISLSGDVLTISTS